MAGGGDRVAGFACRRLRFSWPASRSGRRGTFFASTTPRPPYRDRMRMQTGDDARLENGFGRQIVNATGA
jgi:hypothetical protein